MALFDIPFQDYRTFFLILARISILLFFFPFFNARVIPRLGKVGLALIISLMLLPAVELPSDRFPDTWAATVQLIIGELLLGMVLGLMLQIFFEGVRIMGQLVGFQAGFAVASILDPQSGTQASIMANLAYFVAVLLFLTLDGHHIMLRALRDSFEIVNVGALRLNNQILRELVTRAGSMFAVAMRIGAPAMAALFFLKVVFGLVTKFIPQMNIMIVAFPVQIVVGLIFFGVCLNGLLFFIQQYMDGLGALMMNAMMQMKI